MALKMEQYVRETVCGHASVKLLPFLPKCKGSIVLLQKFLNDLEPLQLLDVSLQKWVFLSRVCIVTGHNFKQVLSGSVCHL